MAKNKFLRIKKIISYISNGWWMNQTLKQNNQGNDQSNKHTCCLPWSIVVFSSFGSFIQPFISYNDCEKKTSY